MTHVSHALGVTRVFLFGAPLSGPRSPLFRSLFTSKCGVVFFSVFRASRHGVGTVGMASRYQLWCPASAASRSPPPRGRVERRPFAADTRCPAEETADAPFVGPSAGSSAVEAFGKAVDDLFTGLSVSTLYIFVVSRSTVTFDTLRVSS